MAPMIFTNLENHVIAANDAFCNLIGYDRAEILGRGTSHFTHPEDVNVVADPQRRLVSGSVDRVSFVKRYLSKDGRVIVISSLKSAARGLDGEILYFVRRRHRWSSAGMGAEPPGRPQRFGSAARSYCPAGERS